MTTAQAKTIENMKARMAQGFSGLTLEGARAFKIAEQLESAGVVEMTRDCWIDRGRSGMAKGTLMLSCHIKPICK